MEINGMEIGMQGIDPASQIARENRKDEKEIRQKIEKMRKKFAKIYQSLSPKCEQ